MVTAPAFSVNGTMEMIRTRRNIAPPSLRLTKTSRTESQPTAMALTPTGSTRLGFIMAEVPITLIAARLKVAAPVSWWHNLEFRPRDEGYTDDLVTRRAIEFIRENKERPFFCYVPFHLVHAPLQAKEEDLAVIGLEQAAKLPSASAKSTADEKRTHAAMLHALDKNVAAIWAELEKLGLIENTILVFTSDNGAMEAGSSFAVTRSQTYDLRWWRAVAHSHTTGRKAD